MTDTPPDEIGEALEALNEGIDGLNQQLGNLEDRLDTIEGDVQQAADVHGRVTDLAERTDELPSAEELEELEERLERLESDGEPARELASDDDGDAIYPGLVDPAKNATTGGADGSPNYGGKGG